MATQSVPRFPWRYGANSVGLRPGVQSGRENVCYNAAGARASVSGVQGFAGEVRGTDRETEHYSGPLFGAGTVGGAAVTRRSGAGRPGSPAARIVRDSCGEAAEENARDDCESARCGAISAKD